MVVRLDEPKRVAIEQLPPGHPLREMLVGLPDLMEEAGFDLVVPVLIRLSRIKEAP